MTKIHQETFGKGKTIVLVHGWAMHSGIWRDFARQLALNYQVICVDLPGHGRSEKIDPFTLEHISTELVNIIPPNPTFSKGGNEQDLILKKKGNEQYPPLEKGGQGGICWLGWSLGATIVLDLAGRFPERVSSLILLAGNPLFSRSSEDTQAEQWPGMEPRLLDDFAGHLNKNCQATLQRFLSLQVKSSPEHKIILKDLKSSVFECAAPDKNTLQGGLDILKNTDLRSVLSGLNIPVSVILGSLDTLVPVEVGQKMQQLLPSLELNIIDRAGHVPFLSHSQETLAIISRFMAKQCT